MEPSPSPSASQEPATSTSRWVLATSYPNRLLYHTNLETTFDRLQTTWTCLHRPERRHRTRAILRGFIRRPPNCHRPSRATKRKPAECGFKAQPNLSCPTLVLSSALGNIPRFNPDSRRLATLSRLSRVLRHRSTGVVVVRCGGHTPCPAISAAISRPAERQTGPDLGVLGSTRACGGRDN